MNAILYYGDDRRSEVALTAVTEKNATLISLPAAQIGEGVQYVDVLSDVFAAKAGDEGYFISDSITVGTKLTEFRPREDKEVVSQCVFLPCLGMNRGKNGVLAFAVGVMRMSMGMVLRVKDGVYTAAMRFYTDGDFPDGDIQVLLYSLDDGSYSAMAKVYRDYQLCHGCEPLSVRAARDSRLKKAADSIAVRIRQGWKPVPSPVENQTPETEPPMHAACTFSRAGDIADAFRKAGIPEAEFCLVGWNYGGHDGRFPQIFPPDPRLGGEDELVRLIGRVKSDGYGIVCHDDATAAYRIADCWDEEYLLRNKDGGLHLRPYCWGGGRPHKICPKRQYERFELVNQPKLAALGFEGIHYIDVMTILPLLRCYDEKHPLTRAGSAEWYRKIMKLSRQTFGGFSSESGFDFAASDLDYVLYNSFRLGKPAEEAALPLCDRLVPFWQLVYHGIILYNPGTYTLNYAAKNESNRLKYFEYGGRPLVCYYANFAQNNHWMGLEDFLCDTDEQLADSVRRIRQMSDDYESLSDVRYRFMESHEKIADGIFRTTYEGGRSVTVNYNTNGIKF